MIIGIAEKFALLSDGENDLSKHDLRIIPLEQTLGDRQIYLAIDSAALKHLLIPIDSQNQVSTLESEGISLSSRYVPIDGFRKPFLDLACKVKHLDLVFERLLHDILERLDTGVNNPVVACYQALDDWRALLRTANQNISAEIIIGLVGELAVLRGLAQVDPVRAIDAWQGPTGAVHDFEIQGKRIEAKATARVDGDAVQISNLLQLDPEGSESLHLVTCLLGKDERAMSVDERIDELVQIGMPKNQLIKLVQEAGYIYESKESAETRYKVMNFRTWEVSPSFPGLRKSALSDEQLKGVVKVGYELQLSALPDPLNDAEEQQFFEYFIGH